MLARSTTPSRRARLNRRAQGQRCVPGRSGVRRLRIRNYQVISDLGRRLREHNLGQARPAHWWACWAPATHIFHSQAAERQGARWRASKSRSRASPDPCGGKPAMRRRRSVRTISAIPCISISPASVRRDRCALFGPWANCPITQPALQSIRAEVRHTDSSARAPGDLRTFWKGLLHGSLPLDHIVIAVRIWSARL